MAQDNNNRRIASPMPGMPVSTRLPNHVPTSPTPAVPVSNRIDPKILEEQRRRLQAMGTQSRLGKMTRAANESGEEFRALAERELGGMAQFNASQRAQEQAARQGAMSASQGAQRALAGRLASQGVRGGSAVAAQMAAANQGAQLQSQIGMQMIGQRADKEQALRQQMLSAILAGKQFGGSQMSEILAQDANIAAARAMSKK